MKTNIVKFLAMFFCLFFSVTISAQKKAVDVNKIVGNWTYSAPDAPYGYQDGTIELKQEKGKLVAKVHIQGSVMTISDIKTDGNQYKASFYLDGAEISLTLTQNDSKLEGEAYAEGMDIAIIFKRVKEKK